MQPKSWGHFLALIALCTAAGDAGAQRVILGKVVDSTGTPVVYANVLHRGIQVVANDSGHFRLDAPSGSGVFHVRRIGFRTADVDYLAGGDTTIVVVLPALPAQLSRTVVLAQAAIRSLEVRGFYRRLHDRQHGTNAGQFITAEEIEQRHPTRVTQLFEGRTGIRATRSKVGDGCGGYAALTCWAPQGPGGCWMTVYYDGQRLRDVSNFAGGNAPTLVDQIALPGDIAGIEIYTTPGKTPPEYQSLNGRCGVVLLWSK
jgi:hypothetical protein